MMKKLFDKIISAVLICSLVLSFATGTTANAAKNSVLKLNKKKISLGVGDTFKLKTIKKPAKAKISWKSSKKSVAKVSKKGKVTAVKAGAAKITAKTVIKKKTLKAVCKVTVNAKTDVVTPSAVPTHAAVQPTDAPVPTPTYNPVDSISVKSENLTLNMLDSIEDYITVSPSTSSLADCKITGTKDYVASMDATGKITANYIGTTFITVESVLNPEVKATLRVDVTDDFTPPVGFDQRDSNVPRGNLTDFYYDSDYRDGGRGHALIWFPHDYDESKTYNLLFCLHGGMDNEYYWTGDKGGSNDGCKGDIVLDNLYASGQMEETIVVFPHGVINYNANKNYPNVVENPYLHSDNDFWVNHYLLEFEILNNLLPYMRENYNVGQTSAETAVCGLSMGCAQSMEIGLKNPEMFDYVGCFSAGPFEDKNQFFVNSNEDADAINDQLKLLFFITGEHDHAHDDSLRNFIQTCNGYNLNNVFYEVKGVGHDDYCWDKALYAFMKYAFK